VRKGYKKGLGGSVVRERLVEKVSWKAAHDEIQ
jgi:hypothetical protein